MNKFSKRLKEILLCKEISQVKFAKMINVKKSSVSQWISGRCSPNLELFFRICLVLNESADYLLGLED